jgi:hypothetical protein
MPPRRFKTASAIAAQPSGVVISVATNKSASGKIARTLTRNREDRRAGVAQPRGHCLANPFGSACDENAPAIKFMRIHV